MFSRDSAHYRMAPRSLQTSKFGPYSVISIPSRRSRIAPVLWAIAYGVAIGVIWYVAVLARA